MLYSRFYELYKEYFPLESDEQKIDFLRSNGTAVLRFLDEEYSANKSSVLALTYGIRSKFKNDITFTGAPNYKNIAHNESVAAELDLTMKTDSRLIKIQQDMEKNRVLAYSISVAANEEVSLSDANDILIAMKAGYRRDSVFTWVAAGVIILITIVIAIWLLR